MLALVSAGLSLNVASRVAPRVARMSSPAMSAFYDFSATTLDGKATSMKEYEGKPVLILNVASL